MPFKKIMKFLQFGSATGTKKSRHSKRVSNWFVSINNAAQNQSGLSLLEACIGMVFIGLIAIPILELNTINRKRVIYYTTEAALDTSLDAINIYLTGINGAYPCPASLVAKEGDSDYGVANDCDWSAIRRCTSGNWRNRGGICRTSNNQSNAVIIGAVPFATLNLRYTDALDYWGNKLFYAVSYSQTNSNTYTVNGGSIKIMSVDRPDLIAAAVAPYSSDEDGVPDELSGSYDLVLFSTGRTARGGYNQYGEQVSNCPSSGQSYDKENCDMDERFFAEQEPNYIKANAVNLNENSNAFFDDQTNIQLTVPTGSWSPHKDNNTYSQSYAITSADKISIGTTTPDPNATFHVVGSIRIEKDPATADTGFLQSEEICTSDMMTCFDPSLITFNSNQMNCDVATTMYGKHAVTKIGNGITYCGSADEYGSSNPNTMQLKADTDVIPSTSCNSSGQLSTGFNSSGTMQCSDIF